MKAIRIHKQENAYTLVYEDVPQPLPSAGEVLVNVYASSRVGCSFRWRNHRPRNRRRLTACVHSFLSSSQIAMNSRRLLR